LLSLDGIFDTRPTLVHTTIGSCQGSWIIDFFVEHILEKVYLLKFFLLALDYGLLMLAFFGSMLKFHKCLQK
jgi:hypothetical protein